MLHLVCGYQSVIRHPTAGTQAVREVPCQMKTGRQTSYLCRAARLNLCCWWFCELLWTDTTTSELKGWKLMQFQLLKITSEYLKAVFLARLTWITLDHFVVLITSPFNTTGEARSCNISSHCFILLSAFKHVAHQHFCFKKTFCHSVCLMLPWLNSSCFFSAGTVET